MSREEMEAEYSAIDARLAIYYTPLERVMWWSSPQEQLQGGVALDLLRMGKHASVIRLLDQLDAV
jgi:hypothetical protein